MTLGVGDCFEAGVGFEAKRTLQSCAGESPGALARSFSLLPMEAPRALAASGISVLKQRFAVRRDGFLGRSKVDAEVSVDGAGIWVFLKMGVSQNGWFAPAECQPKEGGPPF